MKRLSIAVAAALLGACVSVPERATHEALSTGVSERTGVKLERTTDEAGAQAAAALVEELLAAPLSRDAAVRVAVASNRGFQAQFAALGAAASDFHAALVPPNPVLEIGAIWASGGGGPAWEFGLTQSVMALLTRPARRGLAEATLQERQLVALETTLALLNEVEQAWIHAVADAEIATLLETAEEITGAGLVAAQALSEVGNIARIELARERTLHEETRLRAARAETRAVASREALVRHLGLWERAADLQLPAQLPTAEPVSLPQDMEGEAVLASLRLAQMESAVVAAARQARLTDGTALLPHLELGLHFERERDGDREWGPSLEFELPVFDQGLGRRAGAMARLEEQRHRWWQSAVEVRSFSRSGAFALLAAAEQAEHARNVLLPLAAELLDLTVRDWNAMMAGPFELLDARRGQLTAALHDVESRREYWLAALQVEHLRRGGAASGAPHQSAAFAAAPERGKGH
jgi:multidrug efflux system outer membrane protein